MRTARTPAARPACASFTLIELLVSITILMMIVSVLGVIFTESDRAWHVGTGRAVSNTEGRAAVEQIARDLQYAIADDLLTFCMRVDGPGVRTMPSGVRYPWPPISYGFTNSEMCFVSLEGTPDAAALQRGTRCIYYWVRESTADDTFSGTPLGRFELMRTEVTALGQPSVRSLKPYRDPLWYEDVAKGGAGDRHTATAYGVIAGNITAISFLAPSGTGYGRNYLSTTNNNRLPEYVDVVVEVLSDEDAEKVADMELRLRKANNPALRKTQLEYIERHGQRYTSRVYFLNRSGYKVRP